jgi:hypothetical protein
MVAAQEGHAAVVQLLMAAGADAHARIKVSIPEPTLTL